MVKTQAPEKIEIFGNEQVCAKVLEIHQFFSEAFINELWHEDLQNLNADFKFLFNHPEISIVLNF